MGFIKREDFNEFCDVLDLKAKFLNKLGVMSEESELPKHVHIGNLWAKTGKIQEVARIEKVSARPLYNKRNSILVSSLFNSLPNEELIIRLDHTVAHKDLKVVYTTLDSMLVRTFGETLDLLIPVIAYGMAQVIRVKGAIFMGFSDFTFGNKKERIPFYTEYRIQDTGKVTVENPIEDGIEFIFNR